MPGFLTLCKIQIRQPRSDGHHVWQLLLPVVLLQDREELFGNLTVVLVVWVDAWCPVMGTNVAGVAVNGDYCVVPFQEALSSDKNKAILLPLLIFILPLCCGSLTHEVCCAGPYQTFIHLLSLREAHVQKTKQAKKTLLKLIIKKVLLK